MPINRLIAGAGNQPNFAQSFIGGLGARQQATARDLQNVSAQNQLDRQANVNRLLQQQGQALLAPQPITQAQPQVAGQVAPQSVTGAQAGIPAQPTAQPDFASLLTDSDRDRVRLAMAGGDVAELNKIRQEVSERGQTQREFGLKREGLDIKREGLDLRRLENEARVDERKLAEETNALRREELALKIGQKRTKIAEAEKEKNIAKKLKRTEALSAVDQIDGLLSNDRFSLAFGKVAATTPDILKGKDRIDAIAEKDRVVGLLSLESRQKLKGQGTITDSEAKTLEQSATVLANPLISDELAEKELIRVKRIFEDAALRNKTKGVELPQGVSEDDIAETMRANNMTREQVLQRLQGQ